MKKRILFLAPFLILALIVSAAEALDISGVSIPIIEGSGRASDAGRDNANVETYIVNKPLAEVVAFYASYFKDNAFLIIGGEDSSGFNASVKKNAAMFTVKIYSQKDKTILQFIW